MEPKYLHGKTIALRMDSGQLSSIRFYVYGYGSQVLRVRSTVNGTKSTLSMQEYESLAQSKRLAIVEDK